MRGVAAIWIVLFHLRLSLGVLAGESRVHSILQTIAASGYQGVDLFFVLSGFILSYVYTDRFSCTSGMAYRKFAWNRLSRVYPLYFLSVVALYAATLFLAGQGGPMRTYYLQPVVVLANFFLIQNWVGIMSIDVPTWAISALWIMYAVFPVLLPLVARVKRPPHAVLLAAVCMGTFLFGVSVMPSSEPYLRVTCEFLAGCLLYRFFIGVPSWRLSALVTSLSALGILLGVVLLVLGRFPSVGLLTLDGVRKFWAAPLCAALVLGASYSRGPLCRALSSRTGMAAGALSYSLFVTHGVVIVFMTRVLNPTDYVESSAIVRVGVAATWCVAVVLAAALSYRLVEAPARVAMRAWFQSRPRKATPNDS